MTDFLHACKQKASKTQKPRLVVTPQLGVASEIKGTEGASQDLTVFL
jgi:hypothetical protein